MKIVGVAILIIAAIWALGHINNWFDVPEWDEDDDLEPDGGPEDGEKNVDGVHMGTDGQWYFEDYYGNMHGPFETEAVARHCRVQYTLDTPEDDAA